MRGSTGLRFAWPACALGGSCHARRWLLSLVTLVALLGPGQVRANDVLIGSGNLPINEPLMTPERIVTLKSLYAANHPWAQAVKMLADWQDPYGDLGQWDTLTWIMTGDASYARSAIQVGLANFHDPGNANDTRENFIHWALHYAWLKGQMTPDEKAQWRANLRRWSQIVLDVVPNERWFGTRLGDSDVTVGHHLGLAVTRLVTADEPLIEDLLAMTPGPKGSSFAAQQQTIAEFCARSAGGEWIESSSYNPGTMSLLFMGAHAAGIASYPEVADLGRQVADFMPWTFTPDYQQVIEWGDDSWPRDRELWSRSALLSILIGSGLDTKSSGLVLLKTLTDNLNPYPPYWYDLCRALYFYDPRTPLPANPPAPPTGTRVAEGVGIVLNRGPNHLLHINAPNVLGVDHALKHGADLKLWYKGEWVLDSPRGYEPGPDAVNAVLFSGLGPMWSHQFVAGNPTDSGTFASWSTKGSYYQSDYYNPPPEFVKNYRREINFFSPRRIIVRDYFEGLDPKLMDVSRYYASDQAAIANRPGLWTVTWYCPTQPIETPRGYFWYTPSGRRVNLAIALGRGRFSTKVVKNSEQPPGGYYDPNGKELDGWRIQINAFTAGFTDIGAEIIIEDN